MLGKEYDWIDPNSSSSTDFSDGFDGPSGHSASAFAAIMDTGAQELAVRIETEEKACAGKMKRKTRRIKELNKELEEAYEKIANFKEKIAALEKDLGISRSKKKEKVGSAHD